MVDAGRVRAEVTQGIQKKFLVVLVFLALIFSLNLGYELYALFRISNLSRTITGEELPRLRAVQESFRIVLDGRFAFGEALRITESSRTDEVRNLESDLQSSMVRFDSYLAAMTWGSESEAFRISDGGLNSAEWERLGLAGDLVVAPPSEDQMQYAGIVDIYFGGFSVNALRALADHKKFLRLDAAGGEKEAVIAHASSQEHFVKAKRFFDLASGVLSEMARDANIAAALHAENIEHIQRVVFFNVFIFLIVGFLVSVAAVLVYTKQSGELVGELDSATKLLLEKDRALTDINTTLTQFNQEISETAKVLVRRDLELTEANERLLELDSVKSEFVSVAAHQLRTPLTGIRWSFLAMREKETGRLNQDQQRIIETGLGATTQAIQLVNDLLNVARIEEGRFGFSMRLESLLPVIQKTREKFEEAASRKGIVLAFELPRDILPDVMIDGEKIGMALEILIDNAIKYTVPGGRVGVRVARGEGMVQIDVEDTGVGIPKDQLKRVFTKFFRADNALLLQTAGNGLGLYVAKNIVERHGGSIWFESVENKGSTFHFTIPLVTRTTS